MRFKFTCTCGKRLAAYSWMAGKVTECPKCGKTLTIPTPERAAELLSARGEQFVSRHHHHLTESERRGIKASGWALVALVFVLSATIGILLGRWYFYHN